jgi:hypothetical protein
VLKDADFAWGCGSNSPICTLQFDVNVGCGHDLVEPLRNVGHQMSPPGKRSVHEAQLRGHEVVDAEHLLWALTREPDATAVNVLNSCGVPCESIRQRIELKLRA